MTRLLAWWSRRGRDRIIDRSELGRLTALRRLHERSAP